MLYDVLLRFTPVYLSTLTFIMLNCLLVRFFMWNSSDPKDKSSFYVFIMNNNVLFIVLCVRFYIHA